MSNSLGKLVHLICVNELSLEQKMQLRNIRNEEGVRKWMYSDHEISEQEHLSWLERTKHDHSQLIFSVLNEERVPIGVVSVSAINQVHKRSDWAYYLTGSARGGLGSALEFSFINFIFDNLHVEKLNCEVIAGNDAVVKMHKKFGFVEEGFRRENIVKMGQRLGVHFLGLTKDDWMTIRASVYDKYQVVFNKYNIVIEYNH